MAPRAVLALAALTALLAVAALEAQADFAAVTGFSGRRGVDCTQCHTRPPMDLTYAPAEVTVSGLPDGWSPGEVYPLTVTVSGGPPALPPPAPQGGFELEVSAGTLHVPDAMAGLLRPVGTTGMTYFPEGTLMRTWQVDWQAPGLDQVPANVGVWVAAVSANGNHNAALNASDAGEMGDSVATAQSVVPPAPSAQDAWRALPLAPPALDAPELTGDADDRLIMGGRHEDANATVLAWEVAGDVHRRDTGRAWLLDMSDLPIGDHDVLVWSEGAGRASAPQTLTVHVTGTEPLVPDRIESPAPGPLLLLGLLVLWRRP